MKIIIFRYDLFDIRKRHIIESIRIHSLEVFTVHPLELCIVKYRRALAHLRIIKLPDELIKAHYLNVIFGRPSEKRNKIDYSLGDKSLLDKILI